MTFIDQLNRPVILNGIPERIVSLVPSQTELLVDLGIEDLIVGITKFCVHPIHLKKDKTIVGGTKQVDYDKIKALRPELILCNKEENTIEIIRKLEKIAPVHISVIDSFDDCLALISMYGEMFSKKKIASILVENIQSKIIDFKDFIKERPLIKVSYFIWKDPWMVAANRTFINEILALNKFENTYQHLERYPEVKLDSLLESDVVLLSSEPYPFKANHVFELRKYAMKAKIILVDGEYFSWYGSRLLKAFDYFKVLHVKHFNQMP
ncbi:cobalamin-binding protein [Flavobacteriales bacterium 34_180_T64]|nr:cobalamin-binding protein [Flavobacteriales bacterium 34_180_T64]